MSTMNSEVCLDFICMLRTEPTDADQFRFSLKNDLWLPQLVVEVAANSCSARPCGYRAALSTMWLTTSACTGTRPCRYFG
jgi:hypothetical protein